MPHLSGTGVMAANWNRRGSPVRRAQPQLYQPKGQQVNPWGDMSGHAKAEALLETRNAIAIFTATMSVRGDAERKTWCRRCAEPWDQHFIEGEQGLVCGIAIGLRMLKRVQALLEGE